MVFTPLRLYTQVKDCWGGGDPSLAPPASGTGTAMGHETPLKSSVGALSGRKDTCSYDQPTCCHTGTNRTKGKAKEKLNEPFCCDNLGTDLSEGGAFAGQFQYDYVPCVAGNVCLLSAMVVIYSLLWVLDRYSRLGCLNPMIDILFLVLVCLLANEICCVNVPKWLMARETV